MPSVNGSNLNPYINSTDSVNLSFEEKKPASNEAGALKEVNTNTTSEDNLVSFEEEGTENSSTKTNNAATTSGNSILDGYYLEQQAEINRMEQIQQRIEKRTQDLAKLKKRLNSNNLSDNVKNSLKTNIGKVQSDISSLNSELGKCQSNLSSISSKIQSAILNINNTTTVNSTGTIQNASFNSGTTAVSQIPTDLAQRLDSKLGSGFAAKCEEISAKLNCNPNDLLAMMFSESGIDPHCVGYNGAVGLCMFMPSVLAGKGYNSSQVAAMSGVEQLDLVYEFLHESKTSFVGLSDSDVLDAGTLYAMNFLPAYAKNEVLCSAGSVYYSANSPLDLDGDGNISKTDLAKRLSNKFDELYKYY